MKRKENGMGNRERDEIKHLDYSTIFRSVTVKLQ